MGNTKSIPVVGEVVTVAESAAKITAAGAFAVLGEEQEAKKLAKGAGNAWVEYAEKNIIVGPINSGIRLINGDKEGAERVIKSTGRALESVADSAPVVGHVKGVIHYATGDTEHGDKCMIGASRTTVVLGAGLVTGGLGAGAAAGGLAGIGGGVAYDGVHSVIDSGVKKERSTHGIWNIDRDAKACKNADEVMDFELGIVGSVIGDFMAGSSAAEAGKALRKANKLKTQQNKLKRTYEQAAEGTNVDPKLAYEDTIDAARNLDQHIQDGTVKGDGHVSTRARNMETGEVNQGYNARARSDMNVKDFETNGEQSGFRSKTQAKKAASRQGPSEVMKQNPEVEPVMSKRNPQSCAEHQALDGFYKNAQSGSASTTAQIVSVKFLKGIYETVVRCGNCKAFATAMGQVVTDLAAGQIVPVARITPYITTSCRCGAIAASVGIATTTSRVPLKN